MWLITAVLIQIIEPGKPVRSRNKVSATRLRFHLPGCLTIEPSAGGETGQFSFPILPGPGRPGLPPASPGPGSSIRVDQCGTLGRVADSAERSGGQAVTAARNLIN